MPRNSKLFIPTVYGRYDGEQFELRSAKNPRMFQVYHASNWPTREAAEQAAKENSCRVEWDDNASNTGGIHNA